MVKIINIFFQFFRNLNILFLSIAEELMNTHVDPIVIKRTVRQNVRDRSPIRPRSPLETYQYRVSKIKFESFPYLLSSRIFEFLGKVKI